MSGCDFQKKSFRVFMSSHDKVYDKCLRCRNNETRTCKKCKKYSKFEDRGFVFIDRRNRK